MDHVVSINDDPLLFNHVSKVVYDESIYDGITSSNIDENSDVVTRIFDLI